MRSVMDHQFSQVPRAEIPRSQFNRSCGLKTTFDSGYLVPIFVDEALPGDTFNCQMTSFARLATPLHPFMDNLVMDTFFFAVPMRLVWDNFQKFNGEQIDPEDSTDFLVPHMVATAVTGYENGSIHDYLGLPTQVPGFEHSALWHRAYNLIWNEWFRDQNLQDSLEVPRGDGPDSPSLYSLKRRGKRHDYFTSCLPWPQKGPAVGLNFTETADIVKKPSATSFTSTLSQYFNQNNAQCLRTNSAQSPASFQGNATATGNINLHLTYDGTFQDNLASRLEVDMTTAAAVTINALREAFQVQKLYERDARGGTRYIEIIKSHFGVTSPDARLQRPEYLGGGSTRININAIAQTSSTDGTSPQGNLAAVGTALLNGNGFTKSFTEHCLLLGLVCIRADLNYQQGLDRMFSRQTRFDFYWPVLSHIGEQAVLNKEIYTQAPTVLDPATGEAINESVFGYQERYAEYRYKPSKITGQFRSNFAQSLDAWHLAQDFSALPVLNSSFIEENPPVDRVIAVPSYPHILFDSYFDLKCARPMPVYSVPGLIDHF